MQVEILNSTDDPEELVCTAARNDYRSTGVQEQNFKEVMESVNPDEDHLDQIMEEDWSETEGDDELQQLARESSQVTLEAKKRTLLDHLIDSGHWGPFEHPQATVSIEGVTRVLMAQITRHRHFTFDIMSLRYVGVDDLDYDSLEDRFQVPQGVKDGEFVAREGVSKLDDPEKVEEIFLDSYQHAVNRYTQLLDLGVPQQEARKVLPMGTKVNIVMSANARAWMHILNVRTKANVQGETRRCAEAIFQELKEWMPYAFEKYDEDVLPLKLNP